MMLVYFQHLAQANETLRVDDFNQIIILPDMNAVMRLAVDAKPYTSSFRHPDDIKCLNTHMLFNTLAAIPVLETLLKDPNTSLRQYAQDAINEITNPTPPSTMSDKDADASDDDE